MNIYKKPQILKENFYIQNKEILNNIKKDIRDLPYNKITEQVKNKIEFIRTFKSQGVQGIVGFVKLKKNNQLLVFKVSTEINNNIEHEFEILENFNTLRNYCPHFVRSIEMIKFPISTNFIYDPYNNNLFDYNEETLPRNVLFMEYVNKTSFHTLQNNSDDNKNICISQILQVLLALEISQYKKNFTHYDLHTSNILVQTCEINSVFIYCIEKKFYIVPTFGFFPLIIDVGLSYCHSNINKKMMTHTESYNYGFQSVVYDRLNDVHHFLLTTFYYMEDTPSYDSLSNKIKFIFRHLPVLRKNGWKQLPNDLYDIVIYRLKQDCDNYTEYNLFDEYDKSLLEILNNLITLPLKHKGSTDFGDCFHYFMIEFHKMIDIDDFSKQDVCFIMKEIVSLVNKYKDNYFTFKGNIENFKKELIYNISQVLKENVVYENVNYEKLLVSAVLFAEKLESNYFELLEENNEIIENSYSKTFVQYPIDMFHYISRNMTPSCFINKETIVYFWDTDNETNRIFNCNNLSIEFITNFNREFFINKAEMLINQFR